MRTTSRIINHSPTPRLILFVNGSMKLPLGYPMDAAFILLLIRLVAFFLRQIDK